MNNVVLAGLTWKEQYNCYSTLVGRFYFPLSFAWNNGVFVVKVNDQTLSTEAKSPEHAAVLAINAAHALLQDLQKELPDAKQTAVALGGFMVFLKGIQK